MGKKYAVTQQKILLRNEITKYIRTIDSLEMLLFCLIALKGGLRLNEILSLEYPDDFLIKDGFTFLSVRESKFGKSRLANIDNTTFGIARCYCETNKIKGKIFLKDERTYERRVKAIGVKAGITRVSVFPHMFRHTNITMLIENGMDLAEVRQHAGHSNIKSTMVYVDLSTTATAKSYQKAMGD